MKCIGWINGSPRAKESFSGTIIECLAKDLKNTYEDSFTYHVILNRPLLEPQQLYDKLLTCDTLVFVFPLYVDSIPSHLLEFMRKLENYKKSSPSQTTSLTLYGIVNCGFMEGFQNTHALMNLQNYCKRMDFNWGGGIGIGSGEMFKQTMNSIPPQAKIQVPIWDALKTLTESLQTFTPIPTPSKQLLVSQNFPTRGFFLMGNMGWRMLAHENKVNPFKMHQRPLLKKTSKNESL